MKSFKISTAYDVWFSKYRPSNLVINANFAQVVVFINFVWAVYVPAVIHNNYTYDKRVPQLIHEIHFQIYQLNMYFIIRDFHHEEYFCN